MRTLICVLTLLFCSCFDSSYKSNNNFINSIQDSTITAYTPNNIIKIDEFIKIVYLFTDTFINYEKQRELVRCNPVIIRGKDTIIIPTLTREYCGFEGTQESDISPNKKFINLNRIDYGFIDYGDSLIWIEKAYNYVINLKNGECMNSNYIQSGGEWTKDNKFILGGEVIFDGTTGKSYKADFKK